MRCRLVVATSSQDPLAPLWFWFCFDLSTRVSLPYVGRTSRRPAWSDPGSCESRNKAIQACANGVLFFFHVCLFMQRECHQQDRTRQESNHWFHDELWEMLWQGCDQIRPPIQLHSVWRSHVSSAEKTTGLISTVEALGNQVADDFAGRGALSNALPMHVAAAVRHLDTRAKPVQARLLEVYP